MDVKLFEVRDRATFIPVMAVRLRNRDPSEYFLLRRAGYAGEQIDGPEGDVEPYVILCMLDQVEAHYDAFDWQNRRTMTTAHRYVIAHWKQLESGAVIDVEFILHETAQPKVSEAFTYPL